MSFIVEFILHKYLDKFFYGIDKKNIQAGLLDGRITISNIGLQQNLLDNFNFPIKINYSYVEKIQLHIPWRSQQTPMNIYISNIYALISAKDKNFNIYQIFMKKKQKIITQTIAQFLESLKQKPQNQKDAGMIKKQLTKLLYNINLNIGCIHFRYEQEPPQDAKQGMNKQGMHKQGFSFGLKINNIMAYNVNKQGKKEFFNYQKSKDKIIRSQLSIDFIGLYVNSRQTKFIYKKNKDKDKQKRSSNFLGKNFLNRDKQSKQASKKDYAYLTNQMRQISFPQKLLSHNFSNQQDLHYILVISVKTLVSYNLLAQQKSKEQQNILSLININNQYSNIPIISFDIQLPSVSVKITQQQYRDIKQVTQFFSSFQNFWNEYVSYTNLLIYKEINYFDMSNLLRQRRKKLQLNLKEKYQLKSKCRSYLKWIFLTVYQQRLKRRFLIQALKKQITLQNILKNKYIYKIIRKTNQQKLKSWILQALSLRVRYLNAVSMFQRSDQKKIKQFLNKSIGNFQTQNFRRQNLTHTLNSFSIKDQFYAQKPLEYEFTIKINNLTCQISKLDQFGVGFLIKNLRSQFLKRKENYSFQIKMQDLQANVFSSKNGQKRKTIVPIIQKSIIQNRQIDLLYLKYQKNPIGRLHINAQIQLDFQSIEITIYPQAFKQFYQILFSQVQEKKSQQTAKNKKLTTKKNTVVKKNEPQDTGNFNNQYQTSGILLKNNIKGKIRSPWIIFPLGRNNNPQKQCWVVRLGDFYLQTPQVEMSQSFKQKENLYDQYSLELKQFQLKFFSSVKFFYNWLKFNQNQEALYSISYYKDQKIINMIKPFTCTVDFSLLKSGLSSNLKARNYAYMSHIHIQGIQIFASNFLLQKLKQRIDLIGDQQNYEEYEFIERNVQNIYEQNVMSGWAKVSNQKWQQMKFFIILKGHFIYYFRTQNQKKYYFFTDVKKTMIRLVGRSIQKLNTQATTQKVNIYLDDPSTLNQWKKHIVFCLQKKQKKTKEENQKDQQLKSPQLKSVSSKLHIPHKNQKKQSITQPQQSNASTSTSHTKMHLSFIMNRLQIKLKDKQDKQFLLCYFKKTNFTYKCLHNPEAAFSLSSWDIFQSYEHKQKEIPFLSSKRFYNSDEIVNASENKSSHNMRQQSRSQQTKSKQNNRSKMRKQQHDDISIDAQMIKPNSKREHKKQHKKNLKQNNFLQVKVDFNEITNQLSTINVNIDKLFVAWKVDLITKVLAFFFYSSEVGDTPTPSSVQKRTLTIKIQVNKFYLYCYQASQLAGIIKLNDSTIIYHQSNIQQYFDVNFMKFQIDQSLNNSLQNRQSVFISKGQQNPMHLKYHIRKKDFKKRKEFQNVQNLKQQFGEQTIVSLLTCEMRDSVVLYEHQITFRILNYFLGHVLGTVGAKFKKKAYSSKYIYQLLKIQKISVMQISLKNMTFIMPPHNRNQNHLIMQVDEFKITKNLHLNIPQLRPHKISVPTRFTPINIFHQTMYFQFINTFIYQRFGKQNPTPINKKPIDFRIYSSKNNLSTDFYNVLEHYDDFDRQSIMKIQFLDQLVLQLPKITFVTILQIFYQNLKQRDGRAEIFDPPLPYPPKKRYIIQFPAIKANMYEFLQKQKKLQIFNKLILSKFVVTYTVQATKSQMRFQSQQIRSQGQLPIAAWQSKKQKIFSFKMQSDTLYPVTKIQLKIKGYQIDFCFDKLNNILQFINYDSDHVSNKRMPPKASSFMCVNVFANECCVKLEQLWAQGEFFVTYTKNSKNHIEPMILDYLQVSQQALLNSKKSIISQKGSHKAGSSSILLTGHNQQLIDKQIKVDGENIKLSIKGDVIGQIESLYFHRFDVSTKKSMKRFKKQIVQIGETILSIQISDLQRIFKAYDRRIKKDPSFVLRSFFQPWNALPQKVSYAQKKRMQVQFSKINGFLIPNQKRNSVFYFMVEARIPKLLYCTLGKQQQISVDLAATFNQYGKHLNPDIIGEIKRLKIIYKNNKQKLIKDIIIENANQLNIFLSNVNSQSLYLVTQQFSALSAQTNINTQAFKARKYLNYNYVKSLPITSSIQINNSTSYSFKLKIDLLPIIELQSFHHKQQPLSSYQDLLKMFYTEQNRNVTILNENKKQIFKIKFKDIQMGRQIQILNQVLIRFNLINDTFFIDFFQGCILKNNTKLNFYISSSEDKQIRINSGEEKCFVLVDTGNNRRSSTHLNIHKKIQKIQIRLIQASSILQKPQKIQKQRQKQLLERQKQSIKCSDQISVKNSGQEEIFNELIMVKKQKTKGLLTIQLKQKYFLSNLTPFKINLGRNHIVKYQQQRAIGEGLLTIKSNKCSASSYPLTINGISKQISLAKCQQFIQLELQSKPTQENKQQKSKINVYSKKQTIKIYIKSIPSINNDLHHIFLYTKVIYQSLSVHRLLLSYTNSQSHDCIFELDTEKQISLSESIDKLKVINIFNNKWDEFKIDKFLSSNQQKDKSANNQLFGASSLSRYYLIKQKVSLLKIGNPNFKESTIASLKEQLTQTKVKICDCYSLTNITPFVVKIKGSHGFLPSQNKKAAYKKMRKQDDSDEEFYTNNSKNTEYQSQQIQTNQQKPIPYQVLLNSNQKSEQLLSQFLQLCFMDLQNQTKFYRSIKVYQSNINYIQIGQQICKVSVIVGKDNEDKKNEKLLMKNYKWIRIVLERSDEGYKIQNLLENIVVEVKNGTLRQIKHKMPTKRQERQPKNEISFISDNYDIQSQLNHEPKHQILIQPSNFQNIGIKSFSSTGNKILTLQFYYPLKNIDFKQSIVLQLDNLSTLIKKQFNLSDSSKKTSFNIIILTQVIKQNKYHIKLYKKSKYEQQTPEILKLELKQFRLSLYVGQIKNNKNLQNQKLKLQICNLNLVRQKHIDIQNVDLKLEKILFVQGNTLPIIAALDKRKMFLNLQAILEKNPQGLKGKNISLKLTPLEINGRQQIILKLLQKVAKIRSYKIKGQTQTLIPKRPSFNNRISNQRQKITKIDYTIPQPNIQKQWQLLKKGSKPLAIQFLQIFATTIFISYTKSQQLMSNSPFLNDPILKYFLLLPSIGQTKIPIPDFQVKNFNGTSKELLKLIAKQLKSTIGQSILYSLTSLSIFDNPIQAVDDLLRYVIMVLQSL